MIIREYFENLYSNKQENLDEMDKFLDAYNQIKLHHKDISHLNRPVIRNGIEAVIKKLSAKKSPESDGFMAKFYQTIQEELMSTLLRLFQEIKRKKVL
jgi:hypothetical protein